MNNFIKKEFEKGNIYYFKDPKAYKILNEYINREKELLYIEYKLIEQLSIIRNKKNISQREL